MSEYVPTTADIRSDYGENAEGTSQARLAAFDRWLTGPEMTERVARVIYESQGTDRSSRPTWDELSALNKNVMHSRCMTVARAVLAAIAGGK